MEDSPRMIALGSLLAVAVVVTVSAATSGAFLGDAVATTTVDRDDGQLWWRAIALYEQRQFGASSALFEQLAARHGNTPNATVEAALGSSYHLDERFDLAQIHYERALALRPHDAVLVANLGFLFYDTKQFARAISSFERAIELDASRAAVVSHSLAVAYHYVGDDARSEALFETVPQARRTAQYHYDRGVTLEHLGKILEAGAAFNAAIEMDEQFASAWHNIATLHQRYGETSEAIRCYLEVLSIPSIHLELRLMATTNLAVAYETTDDVRAALRYYSQAQALVARWPDVPSATAVQLQLHVARAKRTACIWDAFDADRDALIALVRDRQLPNGELPAFQPFDTLLVDMDAALRLAIARAHSDAIVAAASALGATLAVDGEDADEDADGRLHVGYASYDLNDHPTAHLLEGVFEAQDRRAVRTVAFGYGKDDGSAFRTRLLQLVDEFVNFAAVATADCVREVRARRLDVFMDAQGHTRGARAQISAARPAPVVVNYLVYPGSSGASFVDYVVSDHHTTPPETMAAHFSERLVLLPHAYQVNYYPAAVVPHGRASLWATERADDMRSQFTFVNFNKIDKLEPAAFALWMAILRRVPQSRLVLLDPTRDTEATPSTTADEIVANLKLEAAAHGVAGTRLEFVPRVDKRDHLKRHRHGGLFLDTLVYGAHSTATDALFAGLPVLTLAGDAFASRVGVSLLHNARLGELVTHSRKEFEDLAVAIATEPEPLLTRLRERLRTPDGDVPPLFRTRQHVASLEAAQRAMATLHRSGLRATASDTIETISMPRTAHLIVVGAEEYTHY